MVESVAGLIKYQVAGFGLRVSGIRPLNQHPSNPRNPGNPRNPRFVPPRKSAPLICANLRETPDYPQAPSHKFLDISSACQKVTQTEKIFTIYGDTA
jgi:hypothetical protein